MNVLRVGLIGCALFVLLIAVALIGAVGFSALRSNQPPTPIPPVTEVVVATGTAAPVPTRTPTLAPTEPALITLEPLAAATDTPTPLPLDTAQPTVDAGPRFRPSARINTVSADLQSFQDLETLYSLQQPLHDYYQADTDLGGYRLGPRTVKADPYRVGDTQTFKVDGEEVFARLVGVNDLAYFWVEEGLDVDASTVQMILDRLQNEFYPRLNTVFGTEWRPGMDGDPHFSLLHLNGLVDSDDLGFFDSINQYPTSVLAESNEQEMLFMNMGELDFGEELYYGTLIHEMQHLIQWNQDGNETVWLDEGFAQLAEYLLDFDTADTYDYFDYPDTQLNSWSYEEREFAHYAAAYLFAVYFYEQLGEAAVIDLARHPANGMVSVRDVLADYRPNQSLEQFVSDWTVANWINDPLFDNRYGYNLLTDQPDTASTINRAGYRFDGELPQFAADYIRINRGGEMQLRFAGDTQAELFPIAPHSGQRAYFVPPATDVSATLTRPFDLRSVRSATLEFWAWYDLELEYDYAYVFVSADNGRSWDPLRVENGVLGYYGSSFNGRSEQELFAEDGWVFESISLDSYAGEEILVRFQVLTDASENGAGFAVDDIAIPELGYFDNAELPSDWELAGFAPVGQALPQQWQVRLIYNESEPRVETLPLDGFNQGEWVRTLPRDGGVLIVIPLTPFVDGDADYWLSAETP